MIMIDTQLESPGLSPWIKAYNFTNQPIHYISSCFGKKQVSLLKDPNEEQVNL
jgi:hypothetical protein